MRNLKNKKIYQIKLVLFNNKSTKIHKNKDKLYGQLLNKQMNNKTLKNNK